MKLFLSNFTYYSIGYSGYLFLQYCVKISLTNYTVIEKDQINLSWELNSVLLKKHIKETIYTYIWMSYENY